MKRVSRSILSILIGLMIIIASICATTLNVFAVDPYFAGEGTIASPFLISTSDDLSQLAVLVNEGNASYNAKHYKMTEDIDLSGIENWTPIGSDSTNDFKGTFDGDGLEIQSLTINQASDEGTAKHFGLFGVNTGTIKNLGLSGCDIVVSRSDTTTYSGGIAGYNEYGTITACYNTGRVSGTSSPFSRAGGIAGYNYSGTIAACYNTGSVSATSSYSRAGGIAGYNYSGTITDCYNTGSVSGYYTGGIAGYNESGRITCCYNTGSVSGSSGIGGITGQNSGTITACYYLDIISKGIGSGSGDTIACTLEDMKNQTTYAEFDFESVWEMKEESDYPFPTLIANEMIDMPDNTTDYMSGKGTAYSPYKISTKYQLDKIRKNLGSFYVLVNDIIFTKEDFESDGDFYNNGEGWKPIGTDSNNSFVGHLDGSGFEIKDLTITQESADGTAVYFGLFGENRGTIKNLGLSGNDIVVSKSNSYAGAIAGRNIGSGTITGCYNTGSVSASSSYAGGIAAYNSGTISACYNTGSVSASSGSVGGIAGYNYSGTIAACYNTGSVSATSSYSRAGGIAGYNYSGTITDCYNTGSVSGSSGIGGITGQNSGTITACYYLDIISKGIGSGSGDTIACTLEDMKNQTTYAEFDFESVWEMKEESDYPFPTLIANEMIDMPDNTTDYMSGKGTAYSPYKISTKYQLDKIRKNLGSFYVLVNDIIFTKEDFESDGDFYNNGEGWKPIGTDSNNSFVGHLDGSGFEIKDLTITQESADGTAVYFGLFGENRGTIKNLGLSGNDIVVSKSNSYAGAIAGRNIGSGTITGCYNTGSVSASSSYAGGIAGYNYSGTITNCYNTGSASATSSSSYAGGIAGYNFNSGTITDCYNTGHVSATSSSSYAGGIAGYNGSGTITDCYNTGSVSATSSSSSSYYYSSAGGIAGYNYSGTITDCYNTGHVSATSSSYAGGIAGYNSSGTITACYYLDIISNGIGNGSGDTTSCTLEEMQREETFVGFDFDSIWVMPDIIYTPLLRSIYTPLIGISLEDTSMVTGEQRYLLTPVPINATLTKCVWSSSEPTVASVDSDGIVTGLSIGETYITATSKQGSYTDACLVQVRQGVEHIDLEASLTLYVDDTSSLTATISPVDSYDKSVFWRSSYSNIAEVNQEGLVTAKSPGTAVITVSALDGSGTTAKCTVTVFRYVTGIEIVDPPSSLSVGSNVTLFTEIQPSDASNKTVYWSSSDTDIATVNVNGQVTGVSRGYVTITAETQDGSFISDCEIDIIQLVTEIRLNKNVVKLAITRDAQLEATVFPENANNQSIVWISNNESIAMVSQDGMVTGVSQGNAVISAKSADDNCITTCVVVVGLGVEEITISGNTEITRNDSTQMTAVILPETAINKTVKWSVIPGTGTGTISTNGLLTGKSAGTVTVVATATDGSETSGSVVVTILEIQCNVTFVDDDGTTVLDEQILEYGSTPVYAGETPVKAATEEFTYTFAGWDPEIVAVTGDATYTATYDSEHINYTIVFKDWDGSVISSATYHYGDTVVIPVAPARAADDTYTYTFKAWDPEFSATCEGNVICTATYTPAFIDYTVKFKDWDGSVISTKTYHYGETVVIPENPTREGYYFAGWDPKVSTTCKGSSTYTATYDLEIHYTIVFKNWDGSVISIEMYRYGDTVTVPSDPVRAADDTHTYMFKDWDPEVSTSCAADATYTATYTPSHIDFTVVFHDWDGTVISTNTYHYGDTVTAPLDPTRDADDTYTYTFDKWDPEVVDVAADATYTATYTPSYIDYTVVFKNWDDGVISSETYHYGDTVVVPEDPTRTADDTYTHTFDKWDPEVVDVAADATYTATYDSEHINYTIVFKDWNGSVINSETYHYGDTVVVPLDPTRDADDAYTYTFDKWDPEVVDVAADATYTATYTPRYIDYTVVFKDWDGSVISTKTSHYGETILIPENPSREADDTYTYMFKAWDPEVSTTCAGDAIYTATYTPSYIDYTVEFQDWDGTVISTKTHHYGETVTIPTDPTREGYTFTGWDPALPDTMPAESIVVVAKWTINQYTITFDSNGGTAVADITQDYGTVITAPVDPTREGYIFDGWLPDLPDLMPAGGAGLTAQWTAEPISVSKLPTKIHYIKGESLDVSGGEIRVNNRFDLPMSAANVGAFDSNSTTYGPKTITVEYGGATTSFTVYLNRFSDVPYGYDFYPTIMDLAGKGIVAGYSDGRYGINDNITRAQAAVMLVRALGLETEGLQSNFTDVPNNYWAAAQIAAAAKAKIVNGYGDGRFGPDAKITRAELSVMVARAFDIKVNPNKTVSFTDVPTGFWAEDYIKALASNGIVSGYRDGRFGVKDNATRAQFSKFLSYSLNLAE